MSLTDSQELEKLISYSGTPTVVWRRTGEICLVGVEFCLLTEWKKEDLVGQKYIYEVRKDDVRPRISAGSIDALPPSFSKTNR